MHLLRKRKDSKHISIFRLKFKFRLYVSETPPGLKLPLDVNTVYTNCKVLLSPLPRLDQQLPLRGICFETM